MNEFTWLFVATLALAGGVELWLTARQARAVVAHRDRVPAALQQRISLAAHQKAANYTLAKLRAARKEIGAGALFTLAWTLGGGLATLGALWSSEGTASIWRDTAFMLTAFLAMSLLSLPLALYRTFVIEARIGINRIKPALCVGDLLKQAVLSTVLGASLIALWVWLLAHAGVGWWLWVCTAWMALEVLLLWAYACLIAPLFYR